MIKCPYCKSEDYGKVHGDDYYCNNCGCAFDDKHVELMGRLENWKETAQTYKEDIIGRDQMKYFKRERGNLTLRSCDESLMQKGEHDRAEIVKWFAERPDSCYTIGYYNENLDDGYDFLFVGQRPFDEDVNALDFMNLIELGYNLLMEEVSESNSP